MNIIQVNNLYKHYKVTQLQSWKDYIKYLFGANSFSRTVHALNGISFKIKSGEKVGLLGLNGAGKSTLIKILTGILSSSAGEVYVFGNDPLKNRKKNSMRIGVVFGQRCQLRWDLSPKSSYELLGAIYKISKTTLQERMHFFSNILELDDIIHTPLRNLSLGQKMRVELAGSFLHNPDLIFLDEPTIGLDLLAREKIHEFLKNSTTTMIITSHDVSDIEEICDRIIIQHEGKIIYDGPKQDIAAAFNVPSYLIIRTKSEITNLGKIASFTGIKIINIKSNEAKFELKDELQLSQLIQLINMENIILDITILRKELKYVIKNIYTKHVK